MPREKAGQDAIAMPEENINESSTIPLINIRVESLSDLVFGLALSIGSLELLARVPQTPMDLAVSVGLFGFSFVIVVAIWLGYARIMSVMPQRTGGTLLLNLFLLFGVVLEPYLFFVLQSKPGDSYFIDWASFGYALDIGAMFLILAGLIQIVLKRTRRNELKLHPILYDRYRLARSMYIIVGATYLFSALPFLWIDSPIGPPRFVLWYSAFAFVFLGVIYRRRERSHQLKDKKKDGLDHDHSEDWSSAGASFCLSFLAFQKKTALRQ